MATRGIEIRSLEYKVRIMAETLCELGILQDASRPKLAERAGISYEVLKAAWRTGRLSADVQAQLAEAAGFDPSHVSWIDPSVSPADRSNSPVQYAGQDTPENFRYMLRHKHGLVVETVRVLDEQPVLADSNLLTFSIEDSLQGTRLDQPAALFLVLVVEPGYHESGLAYGFKRVRLRLSPGSGPAIRVLNRLGEERPEKIGSATLTARGSSRNPEWFLEVMTGVLQGEFRTKEHPLCKLAGFDIGETFTAEVAVRLMDGSLAAAEGTELLPTNKKAIVEILSAKKLPGACDSQGWFSLGRQTLIVIRGDRS